MTVQATAEFDRDTAVTPVADGMLEGCVAARWDTGRGAHGGYLAAILLRSMQLRLGDPRRTVRSLSVHYGRSCQPGPVQIDVDVERTGRRLSAVSARLRQNGAVAALAVGSFLADVDGPSFEAPPKPRVRSPDSDRAPLELIADGPPFARQLVRQPRFGPAPLHGADGPMETGGWTGLMERRPIEALAIAVFCDAWFPPPYVRLRHLGPAPTTALTIYFRAEPAATDSATGDLCLARFRSNLVSGGLFDEDGILWAADGRLLAQSRQLGILGGGGWSHP